MELDDALLSRVKERMEEIVREKHPISKRNINTDEAVELFGHYGMHDKEQLFTYRRASRVNLYRIDRFEDYFYGYMVPDTGYIKYFGLQPYHKGFLLLLPGMKDPKKVEAMVPYEKLFHVLRGH